MALIKCPDCKGDVSSAASACPKCARPILIPKPGTNAFIKVSWALLAAAVLIAPFAAMSHNDVFWLASVACGVGWFAFGIVGML